MMLELIAGALLSCSEATALVGRLKTIDIHPSEYAELVEVIQEFTPAECVLPI